MIIQYQSNTGGGDLVDFETAILNGFAEDGGLYVPEKLPQINKEQLLNWAGLNYVDLAFEILSLFIDRSVLSEQELKGILKKAYASFEKEEIIPIYPMRTRKDTYVMELFYGPTLSFKDVGLAFLITLVDFFLCRRKEKRTIVVATTGDTGPATAYFTAGKESLDAWILYPKGMITPEQERQMTSLSHNNVHPVGVYNCPDGGDDLDLVIAELFANSAFKEKVNLTSVNSINWGRVMMQIVHYFYGYYRVVEHVGESINMAVPSGAFGNLCAGALGRKMGLPIAHFVVANNKNACLHRVFSQGVFSKKPIFETMSSAIDILIPYNFWRYLYFAMGGDSARLKSWLHEFKTHGMVTFDDETFEKFSLGFLSSSISDEATLNCIKTVFEEEGYLLDPHGAVALAATEDHKEIINERKLICLATAHPAKFPEAIKSALRTGTDLPAVARHPSIERAEKKCRKGWLCEHSYLEEALMLAMSENWDRA